MHYSPFVRSFSPGSRGSQYPPYLGISSSYPASGLLLCDQEWRLFAFLCLCLFARRPDPTPPAAWGNRLELWPQLLGLSCLPCADEFPCDRVSYASATRPPAFFEVGWLRYQVRPAWCHATPFAFQVLTSLLRTTVASSKNSLPPLFFASQDVVPT